MEQKKRGVTCGHDGDEDLEDEMKMEKFYSLLRSFRDARDQRRRELQELEKHESSVKKMKTNNNTVVKPKAEPSFEWQDFTTEIEFRKPPLVFPNPIPCDTVEDPKKGKKKEQQRLDHALDLKLAL